MGLGAERMTKDDVGHAAGEAQPDGEGDGGQGWRDGAQLFRSQRSLALASATVCHCMLLGTSSPPQASGITWSTIHLGQEPVDRPVAGQGEECLKAVRAVLLRRGAAERDGVHAATTSARIMTTRARGLLLILKALKCRPQFYILFLPSKDPHFGDS